MSLTLNGSGGVTTNSNVTFDNVPTFAAWKSGATQDVGTGVWTKVTFETEEFDTNSNYDTSTSRFTPTVAGYYQVNASLFYDNNGACRCAIYKNGTVWKEGIRQVNAFSATASCLVYLNGSTDYIECYGYESAGYNVVGGTQSYTYFQATLVRSA